MKKAFPSSKIAVRRTKSCVLLALSALIWLALPAFAQVQSVPNFWHSGERLARPDLSNVQRLRFLTTTDFPPFNFIDRRKRLTGFHIDLARAICDELGILPKCQIQALPWEELEKAIEDGQGEAVIAGMDVTNDSRTKYEFSRPYLHIPGRFAARRSDGVGEPMWLAVRDHVTGLVAGSRHEQWFGQAFASARSRSYPTRQEAMAALKNEEVSLVFADAVTNSFWLLSEEAADCCVFAGGPYVSASAFGNGLAIAFPKGRTELADAADYALRQLNDNGTFAELYQRYFPLSLY